MAGRCQFTQTVTDGGTKVVFDSVPEESTTQTILRGIAAIKGVDEIELDPLYQYVDTAALQSLIEHAGEQESPVSVRFSVDECIVSVRSDHSVEVVDESAGTSTSPPNQQ